MLNLSCGRQGEFMKSGDFMLLYSETPNMSEFNSEYAAMERARKPSPPPEGETQPSSTGPGDQRRPLKVFDLVCLHIKDRCLLILEVALLRSDQIKVVPVISGEGRSLELASGFGRSAQIYSVFSGLIRIVQKKQFQYALVENLFGSLDKNGDSNKLEKKDCPSQY
ncbi:hypothetical protein OSTOST_05148 [Ostertagia ostertagi]